ncbi:hypothetical protein B0A48_13511 [Cryoendolithus antarcticus]|uniref:FAD/NAD(P)-binding domain-containing protein n=1 Tax=Cryoendolithus antarcticus TaxID=1507870 RepID=A0A1V8SP46_9PEZI|nr:hypothetical protein B0A48_13511 [Cryoendolithus antarcticus]
MSAMGSDGLGKSICVVGAGAFGLTAVKNFLEEGFEVTCFERNSYIGGLWHSTLDPTQTSTLTGTVSNVSKHLAAYSDFPLPDDCPLYPSAKQVQDYFELYAARFELNKHIHLSTSVTRITRNDEQRKWMVTTKALDQPARAQAFDCLIMATGSLSRPRLPDIAGLNAFRGEIVHSQNFKNPSQYAGQTVLVVGAGATSADSIGYLLDAGAAKVYLSHRRKFVVLPRILRGKALDHNVSIRLAIIGGFIGKFMPKVMLKLRSKMLQGWQNEAFPGLKDHPALTGARLSGNPENSIPLISDHLPDLLLSGKVESVQGIARITGPNSLLLTDGTTLDHVDAILCCTGAHVDFSSLLPPSADPTNPSLAPDNFAALPPHYRDTGRVPLLYRGIISLQYPHSLAFLGHTLVLPGSTSVNDLISMGLAQLWSGKYPFPSQTEMQAEANSFYASLISTLKNGEIAHAGIRSDLAFSRWLHEVAGTGLFEHVGSWTSWRCWKLWWSDRQFYKMLLDGVMSPHAWRLFDIGRGRKTWNGAREAVEKANADMRVLEEREKRRAEEEKCGKRGLKGKIA